MRTPHLLCTAPYLPAKKRAPNHKDAQTDANACYRDPLMERPEDAEKFVQRIVFQLFPWASSSVHSRGSHIVDGTSLGGAILMHTCRRTKAGEIAWGRRLVNAKQTHPAAPQNVGKR